MSELSYLRLSKPEDLRVSRFGAHKFQKEKFAAISNIARFNKPSGGLWLAPATPTGSAWTDWLEEEGSGLYSRDELSSYFLEEFTISSEASILRIDTWADFQEVLSAYLLINEDFTYFGLATHYLDFEKMTAEWDGIYLTENGQWETRYDETGSPLGTCLYGWDLESLLLFRQDVIEHVSEPVSFRLKPAALV